MGSYSDSQGMIAKAFRNTMCSLKCNCGRLHFVAGQGHGEYEPGELEKLLESSSKEPDKFVPEFEFDYVESVYIDEREFIVDCPCGEASRYANWMLRHLNGLTEFVRLALEAKVKDLRHREKTASTNLASIEASVDRIRKAVPHA